MFFAGIMNLNQLFKYVLLFSSSLLMVNVAFAFYRTNFDLPRLKPVFGYEVKPWYKYHKNGTPGREIMLYFTQWKPRDSLQVSISCEGKKEEYIVSLPSHPVDSLAVLLPENTGINATSAIISLKNASGGISREVAVPAKKQWTVYIYPHSHVDIGYTNLQEIVEKLHIRNIDVGIDIANKTKDYPGGAKFVWNPESAWVLDQYLKNATAEQKSAFVAAVKKGRIGIDAAYANVNTSTCSDEELFSLFRSGKAIESLTGVPVNTMVQMDNPGAGWGLVQAAAANGIKGFLSFPNYFDLRNHWENKPFYWEGQNGHKIFYLQATSYGYGFRAKGRFYGLGKIQAFSPSYDRLSTDDPLNHFIDPFIFEETQRLENRNSPYSIFAMAWSMADNCLIDADLPEAVKQWNGKYAYPKLIISGSKEILEAYESRYKAIIPTYKGDLSEFWTNGLGADARSVGIGRTGKEALVQAEALWPMLDMNRNAPSEEFETAWNDALLSAEHTWGFQDPNAPLAKAVEAKKASYFLAVDEQARRLTRLATQPFQKNGSSSFAVINTLSWSRDEIVLLEPSQSTKGDQVVDEQNRPVLSQRLSTGELAFEAKAIPALGSKLFKVVPGKNKETTAMVNKNTLSNELISVTIDEKSGNIKSFINLLAHQELVDQSSGFGFNSYNYLEGVRNGSDRSPVGTPDHGTVASISIKEQGPLVSSILVSAQARGINWLKKEIKILKGQPYLTIVNTIDKIATRTKEGVHFSFPFNVPDGIIKMDIPWGIMSPEVDQIPFTNKNWFSFQRWIDISNQDYGITWTAMEAPLVEFGDITGTILDGARQATAWIKNAKPTQTLISWPLNNHWDTNFPLQQGGIISLKYMMQPHKGAFDPVQANQFGLAMHRPLIVIPSDRNPIRKPLFQIDNPKIMLSVMKKSSDNRALILRFRSLSPLPERFKLNWPGPQPEGVYQCNTSENKGTVQKDTLSMLPFGNNTFRIEF